MDQPRQLLEEEDCEVSHVSPTLQPKSVYRTKRAEKAVFIVSILQMIIGVMCVILQSITLGYGVRQAKLRGEKSSHHWLSEYDPRYPRLYSYADDLHIAPGIWIGLYYITTGIVGIISVIKNNRGLVIAMMILNIILAAAVSAVMVGMMAGLISYLRLWDCKGYEKETGKYKIEPDYYYHNYQFGGNYDELTTTVTYFDCDKTPAHISITLDIIMLIIALINFGIAISLSVAGCCYACSCCNPRNQQLQPYQIVYQNATDAPRFLMAPPGFVFPQSAVPQSQHLQNNNQTGNYAMVQIQPAV